LSLTFSEIPITIGNMELSSQKQTILVFSDSHQEIDKLNYILKNENYDKVVCLGDWFDSFTHDSAHDVESACNFLKKWIFKDNFYTCFGNHDLHYLFGNRYTICSGYTREKDKLITKCLGNFMPAIREKFLWYLWIDDFFCSHAGINSYHLSPMVGLDKKALNEWFIQQIKTGEASLMNDGFHWLYLAGAARGGRMNIGGLTWQDFDAEFEPIQGLKQLCGHTPHRGVLNHHTDGNLDLTVCENLDIDCHLNEYLLIKDGKVTVKKYNQL